MFLYKIEIVLQSQTVYLIALAESDEKAFDSVEGQLARHFVAAPVVREMAIVEKKRADKGSGYIIETAN